MMKRWFVVISILSSFGFPYHGLSSQTAFEIKSQPPNYSTYQRFEECVSVMERIVERNADIVYLWRDTSRFKYIFVVSEPVPQAASDTGKACIGSINVDTVSSRWVATWGVGLLMARLDEQAKKMYGRYLSSIQDESQYAFFENVVKTYAFARPTRVNDVARLVKFADPQIHKDSNFMRLRLHFLLFKSQLMDDQLEAARASILECVEIAKAVTDEERLGGYDDIGLELIMHLKLMYSKDGFDSLVKSTDAYRNHLSSQYSKFFRAPLPPLIGSRLDSVAAAWRFSLNSSDIVQLPSSFKRPQPGKINLFVFLHGSCHQKTAARGKGDDEQINVVRVVYPNDCLPIVSLVKRAKIDFPEIEITVLTRTNGYFADSPPVDTKDEADTLAYYYLKHHAIPGVVFVEETEFIRLQQPDNRRVDELTYNQHLVLKPNGQREQTQAKVLIADEDGRIVHFGQTGFEELEMTQVVLKALTQRIGRLTH